MKHILVPTDFSKTALQAMQFAIEISDVYHAEIMALHIIELPTNILSEYPFQHEVVKEMKKQASANFDEWSKGLPGNIVLETVQSSVVSGIESFIKEHAIDLIVMGTSGVSSLSEFFVGSNTEKIVRFSKVPVFSIKKSVKASAINNIVFPTQMALNETKLVEKVKELQQIFNAHLHILYVNTPTNFRSDKEINAMMKDYLTHYDFDNFSTKVVDDMYEQSGIMSFTNELKGVMIAMATHSRRGLAHFFKGSIAEDLVNHEDCPIWTYSLKNK